jgi:hypothetical protein
MSPWASPENCQKIDWCITQILTGHKSNHWACTKSRILNQKRLYSTTSPKNSYKHMNLFSYFVFFKPIPKAASKQLDTKFEL